MANYDLDALGWLLFERLATDAVARELGVPRTAWEGSCDDVREARWRVPPAEANAAVPVDLRMVWVRAAQSSPAAAHERLARATRGRRRRPLVLVTNADEDLVPRSARALRTLGRRWLSERLDAEAALRLLHLPRSGCARTDREWGRSRRHSTAPPRQRSRRSSSPWPPTGAR